TSVCRDLFPAAAAPHSHLEYSNTGGEQAARSTLELFHGISCDIAESSLGGCPSPGGTSPVEMCR
ncbi:uncharacterized protein PgNI_09684, partial [Pyricularia grisea]|uniref:Uncharacterized protein n=1 Tax=Pyricularia grisea TaxID=148305 RepID=A0A6P8AT24_PYRGI